MNCQTLLLAGILAIGLSPTFVAADESKGAAAPDQATLEKEFVEKMTGIVMIGKFTILDSPIDLGPRPDKYLITKVEKKDGNNWLFVAKVEYELGSYPVAVKVPVEWAGSTPVITVTNMEIPLVGKGVFNARVLFDGDRYAGTWSHDKVGGHMFGRLEKPKPEDAKQTDDAKKDEKSSEKKDGAETKEKK